MPKFISILALLITVSCSPTVFAQSKIKAPKTIPPVIATAELIVPGEGANRKLSVTLTIPKVAWEVTGKKRPKTEWPKLKVNVKSAVLNVPLEYHPATQLSVVSQNRVLTFNGKRLSSKEIKEKIKESKSVLVSLTGKRPDPYYMQFTKPDTLIVVLGIPNAPAPELLPHQKRKSDAKR